MMIAIASRGHRFQLSAAARRVTTTMTRVEPMNEMRRKTALRSAVLASTTQFVIGSSQNSQPAAAPTASAATMIAAQGRIHCCAACTRPTVIGGWRWRSGATATRPGPRTRRR